MAIKFVRSLSWSNSNHDKCLGRIDEFGHEADLGQYPVGFVPVLARIERSFAREIVAESSAISAGELTKVSAPVRTCSSKAWGAPCQEGPTAEHLCQ
jgi:hypothetical protein